ncbi:related to aldehyde dehydrogenase (NAD+), mitochondrial [Cephalotrichum gorgonifer]|uniref:aldehyde dehydrogenase (NAD(+)) n=1 Tax=Cephalotrichum gorgonifer TaxID=2041049 RepID=A0AAE8N6S9_9PEZI|nr:related to aldehyde dehydrogenase (NAD+), mitochondrial [Cephalotrichum gorgonifer]
MDDLAFFNTINNDRSSSENQESLLAPRSNKPLWKVPLATTADVDAAVAASQEAFRSWRQTPLEERQSQVRGLARLLEENKALLSGIISQETGKSTLMSDMEVDGSIDFLKFNAAQSLDDEIAFEDESLKIVTTYHPLGVVAAICPWNFPLVLAIAKVAASLVTGNCMIIKPSPFTPYSTLKFVELASAILPPGVLQALNGGGDVGAMLTQHPGVQKLSFTGSAATGKRIMASAAGSLKRITLELGGNDGCIVCDDVDVERVAREVAMGCFFHAGQMCVATKRVYVHRSVYPEFMTHFLRTVDGLKTDAPVEEPSVFGPISNKMQFEIVKALIEDCEKNGYEVLTGGTNGVGNGLWVSPTVVNNPPDDSRIVKEEQFGPIIPIMIWDTENEVVRRVNDTDCGLGGSIWGKDQERIQRMARSLETSTVWLNTSPRPVPMGHMAGWKESGIGGEWGRQGLLAYCQVQTLQISKSQV